MLTENYKKWINGYLAGYTNNYYTQNLTDIEGATGLNAYSGGNNQYSLHQNFGAHTFDYITKNQCDSIFVGTGQKEESQTDIAIESMIPDNDLIMNSANVNFSEGKFIFTKTFTYIGTNETTINEVVYYKAIRCNSAGGVNVFCLARQKVEPLTVSQNDVFTVSMVIG